MKINGKKLAPTVDILVIPKQSGNIVFKARPVLDYKSFDSLCPAPMAPEIIKKGGGRFLDTTDASYVAAIEKWAQYKTNWMFLEALKVTEDLEWETVKENEPETWGNYIKELTESGFTSMEINRIFELVTTACGLNQDKIDKATQDFLAGQVEAPIL